METDRSDGYSVRILGRQDIDSYVRLVRCCTRKTEPVHRYMERLIKFPVWGVFDGIGVLTASVTFEFCWHRKEKMDNIIILKHCIAFPKKRKENLEKLFGFLEQDIIRGILRAGSIYMETDDRDMAEGLGFSLTDDYHATEGLMMKKEYLYDCVPKVGNILRLGGFIVSVLTEADAEEFRSVLAEGNSKAIAEGADYSFGYFSVEECHKTLMKIPVLGLRDVMGNLIGVLCFELPWQVKGKDYRRCVMLSHGAVIGGSYREGRPDDDYVYRFSRPERFSWLRLLMDYLVSRYVCDMLRCPDVYMDTMYGGRCMEIFCSAGFEIMEHIYTYRSTPHAVLMRKHLLYE